MILLANRLRLELAKPLLPFSISGGFESGADGWTGSTGRGTSSPRTGGFSYGIASGGSASKTLSLSGMEGLTVTFRVWSKQAFFSSGSNITLKYRYSGGSNVTLVNAASLSSGYAQFSGSFLVTSPAALIFSVTIGGTYAGLFDDWSIVGVA